MTPWRCAPLLDRLLQDLRYAGRSLRRTPGATLVAVATLALGIGATAAISAVVNAVLLRDLPYADSDRVALIHAVDPRTADNRLGFSYAEFDALRAGVDAFDAVAAYSFATRPVLAPGRDPVDLPVVRVTEGLFTTLGVAPAAGRPFADDEARSGAPVVILTDTGWARAFGRDPSAIGSSVAIDGAPHAVIGVMPPGFLLPSGPGVALLLPVTPALRADDDRELSVVSRLAAEQAIGGASAQADAVIRGLVAGSTDPADVGRSAWVERAAVALVHPVRRALWMILAAAGLVLLIACANVAGLFVARADARRRELAVHAALGATRWRMARRLVAEGVLLAAAGGTAGLALGGLALPAVVALSPAGTPRIGEAALDARVIATMLVLATATALLASLAPLLGAAGRTPAGALAGGRGQATPGRRSRRLQRGLVVAEMALATVLVFGAVLFSATFARLVRFDRGFGTEHVLVVSLQPRAAAFQSAAGLQSFFDEVEAAVASVPAVTSASLTFRAPDRGRGLNLRLIAPEGLADTRDDRGSVTMVAPGYFEAAGIRVVEGRGFTASDRPAAPAVAMVSRSFASAYLPGADPVGATFTRAAFGDDAGRVVVTVVGVVDDTTPEPTEPPLPMLYLPLAQVPIPIVDVVARFEGDVAPVAGALRDRLWAIDPAMPLSRLYTMEESIGAAAAGPRFHMLLVSLFAALALAVAAVGVYGAISLGVSARTAEIGLRQALGATRVDVATLFVGDAVKLALVGLAIGLGLAAVAGGVIRGLLFDVSPVDPFVHAGVAACLLIVALAATLGPTLRALSVTPTDALRLE